MKIWAHVKISSRFLLIQTKKLQGSDSTIHCCNCGFHWKTERSFLKRAQGNGTISLPNPCTSGTFAGRDFKQALDDLPIDEAVVDGEDVDLLGDARRRVAAVELVRRPPPPRDHPVPGHNTSYWRSAGRNDPRGSLFLSFPFRASLSKLFPLKQSKNRAVLLGALRFIYTLFNKSVIVNNRESMSMSVSVSVSFFSFQTRSWGKNTEIQNLPILSLSEKISNLPLLYLFISRKPALIKKQQRWDSEIRNPTFLFFFLSSFLSFFSGFDEISEIN